MDRYEQAASKTKDYEYREHLSIFLCVGIGLGLLGIETSHATGQGILGLTFLGTVIVWWGLRKKRKETAATFSDLEKLLRERGFVNFGHEYWKGHGELQVGTGWEQINLAKPDNGGDPVPKSELKP